MPKVFSQSSELKNYDQSFGGLYLRITSTTLCALPRQGCLTFVIRPELEDTTLYLIAALAATISTPAADNQTE